MWQPVHVHRLLKAPLGGLGATALVGAACLTYAATYEVRAFRLRRFDVPVLPPGSRPLRLLHVSDMHLTPDQDWKVEWVRGLAALEPDLVVNTGDTIAHPRSVPAAVEALAPLLALPGVFVLGSNDYYAPVRKNPARYLWRRNRQPDVRGAPKLPSDELRCALAGGGWLDLSNARGSLTADGRRLAFTGVDDPHLGLDAYDEVSGPADPDAAVRVGVAHAPYRRVLDAFAADRYDLVLAGHTHGGQVCVPLWGALVTNCDIDSRRVKGVSRWGASWLHVSAGLGTSPFAPFRFACRPEASLLTLRARDTAPGWGG